MRRIAPALGLFFFAPICAEYLIGYDTSVGRPLELLGGLLIFGPLYGAPALIIREVTRRAGRGWPSIFLLALAFGVIQAGLVDQSLFNPSYRDIDYWDEEREATLIPGLGFSAHMALNFVFGHMIWSISAPIAVVETIVARRGNKPWLGIPGLTVTALLWLAASALIYTDHVKTEEFLAPAPQVIGAAVVVILLIGAAFFIKPREQPASEKTAPKPWLVGLGSFAAFIAYNLVGPDWLGVVIDLGLLALLGIAVIVLSRRQGWGAWHRLALASGPLLSYACYAFFVDPLGDGPLAAKLAHNTVLLLGVLLLIAVGARAARPRSPLPQDSHPSSEIN